MISAELEAKILRLHYAEKWRIGTIAKQLGIHHCTVRRLLSQAGIPIPAGQTRRSMVDPYVPFMVETLDKYPTLTAIRLYEMVRERGYPGGPDHFRALVARYRPRKPAEAYLRLRTLPGEQAQVDWGHFGTLRIGRAKRRLSGFVMVLTAGSHHALVVSNTPHGEGVVPSSPNRGNSSPPLTPGRLVELDAQPRRDHTAASGGWHHDLLDDSRLISLFFHDHTIDALVSNPEGIRPGRILLQDTDEVPIRCCYSSTSYPLARVRVSHHDIDSRSSASATAGADVATCIPDGRS